MTSSHRYSRLAVGFIICSDQRLLKSSTLVAEKSVDMETLVDDFVTFYAAGG